MGRKASPDQPGVSLPADRYCGLRRSEGVANGHQWGSNMSEAHELFVVGGMTTTGPAPHYGCALSRLVVRWVGSAASFLSRAARR